MRHYAESRCSRKMFCILNVKMYSNSHIIGDGDTQNTHSRHDFIRFYLRFTHLEPKIINTQQNPKSQGECLPCPALQTGRVRGRPFLHWSHPCRPLVPVPASLRPTDSLVFLPACSTFDVSHCCLVGTNYKNTSCCPLVHSIKVSNACEQASKHTIIQRQAFQIKYSKRRLHSDYTTSTTISQDR
jgi:hypothetical protein